MAEFDFDSWFNNLEEDNNKPKGGKSYEKRDYINKIYSNYPGNWGTIYCIPFTALNQKPLNIIEGVMECKLSVDGGDVRKQKILPREFYSFSAGSQEEKLHGELTALFRQLYDLKGNNYSLANWTNYCLMYAYVLRHMDQSGTEISTQTPSLLVMANRKFKDAWVDSVKEKTNLELSTGWVDEFYNRDGSTKTGLLKISVKRPDNYLFRVDHDEITKKYHGITGGENSVTVDQGVIDTMFMDPINDLLNVDNIDERFNYDWYVKVKESMVKEIEKLRSSQPGEKDQPAPTTEVEVGSSKPPLEDPLFQ